MQISFRSFKFASTPSERTARRTSFPVSLRSNAERDRWIEKFVFPRSCIPVSLQPDAWDEYHATYMVHCPAPTPPADDRGTRPLRRRQVDLFPRVLVASYDDAWRISVQ